MRNFLIKLFFIGWVIVQPVFAQLALTPLHYQQLNLLQTSFITENINELALAEQQALEIISQVKGSPEQQAFVRSFAARLLAQHYMQTDRLALAIQLLEQRAKQDIPHLEKQHQQDLNWQLIHLHTQAADYLTALNLLEAWWQKEENPSADAYYLRAALLAQLEKWQAAKPFILQALNFQQPEAWLGLGVAIMQKIEDWQKAAELQQLRLNLRPETASHWLALAQLQLLANQNTAALITLKLAHQQNYLPSKQIENLGLRLLNQKQNLLAAQVFEQLLQEDAANLGLNKLAAQAWLNTKDQPQTTHALERLAQQEITSRNLGQLGQWYFSLGEWKLAAEKFSQALELAEKDQQKQQKTNPKAIKKYNKHLHLLRLSLAQSYIELNLTKKAEVELSQLTGTYLEAQAKQWVSYLQAIN